MSLFEAAHVSFSFGSHKVLNDLSWQIEQGQAWHLEGENGAGKTTLLHIIANLLRPQRGQARLDGDVSYYGPEIGLYHDLSVYQNLKLFAGLSPLDEAFHQELFVLFDLTPLLQKKFSQLSHGQKFRVQLCRALSVRADLYLLDEPFEGLDTNWLAKLCQALNQLLSKGKTLVVTSHLNPTGFTATHRGRIVEGQLVTL